tara:strand:+ start:386 stop:1234 length:849 start_codon:yes stop_codon:yes gene_type:complete
MTPTTDCDILETIADALTSKFKKELIANLGPYAERIRDGEKYQRVIKQLLETLPEYLELRDKYDSLLQENERLKSSSTTTPLCSQDNIVLDLTEQIASSEVRKVDLTNNIHMVCQTDENTVVNKVEQVEEELVEESEEELEEEESEESEEEQSKPEPKESTIVKREDHPENVTKDKQEQEEQEEQEQAEESEYEEEEEEEQQEQQEEEQQEQAEESEYEEVTDDEAEQEEDQEEEQEEEESEYEEVTDDEAEEQEQEQEEPEQTKPTTTGKRPVLARKVPIN